jgi:hypothetical protein
VQRLSEVLLTSWLALGAASQTADMTRSVCVSQASGQDSCVAPAKAGAQFSEGGMDSRVRGKDGNVRLKPSGVPWLRDVPVPDDEGSDTTEPDTDNEEPV